MRRTIAAAILTGLLGLLPASALAGNPYLSVSLQRSETTTESDILGDGEGAEISLGYFFTPRWALEFAGFLSDFGNPEIDGSLGGFSVNTRFSPLPESRLQPWGKLGLGAYFLSEDGFSDGLTGPGFNFGGGIDFFLVPGLAVGGEVTMRYIIYTSEYYEGCCGTDTIPLDQNLDGPTVSVGFNISYHFR